MKKTTIWLIIAVCLVLVGGAIFTIALMRANWDFKSATPALQTKTVQINEAFTGISIDTDTEDIVFRMSDDKTCKVVFVEHEKEPHTAVVKNGILTIEVTDERNWQDRIISYGNPSVTVYLPEKEYKTVLIREHTGKITVPNAFRFESVDIAVSTGDVSFNASALGQLRIETDTGDIGMEGISAGELRLKVTTGKVDVASADVKGDMEVTVSTGKAMLQNISCTNFQTTGSTGRITMENMICGEKLTVNRSTGDVTLNGCDAAELEIETNTGNVKGTLLSEKIFFVKTSTGKVEVPETMTGGKCKVTTSTGDVIIQIQ